MRIAIASSDDLAALYATYLGLIERGDDDVLELDLAPGDYGVASIGPISLDLGGDPAAVPAIDVVIRGSADGAVVLRDLGVRVHARSLVLENLIFTGRPQGVLDARVARGLVMRRCVVAGNAWGGPWGGALLRVAGVHGQPAFTVEITDSWLVGNSEQSHAALLEIAPATGSFVEQVTLRGVGLIGNTTHSDVVLRETRALHAEDLLVIKDHAGGAVVVRHERTGKALIESSVFVVTEPAALVAEDTRTWSSGVELVRSEVFVSGASRKLPHGVRSAATPVTAAPVAPSAALVDGLIDALCAGRARALPDSAALRAHLRAELGL